ncbi:MAG: hypothetical protein COX77_02115 [Candidatus Komeilibacteria bacterium CG_4_10_14_0_2_um_filter_37_10]|uniref:Major facilitator superfamily (MFS) profile domain-containing protein n=1 Tax=Candidatus Komeilibacteria bacterium CG_4_10_14_0_2_um_filter_37_10 TaxID=1974470 RepID=A0A2M7VFL9_9BACT|nr:MAG: hypothetical protein COX77_02115 [Candidatus Komeilibacteria bacterium CG_4_10_14_0_2_um_filter_37_10]
MHFSIYVSFLLQNKLNFLEVSLVNAFFMLAVFLLETPTGAVADLFGRKTSYVLASLVNGLGFVLYSQVNTFWLFVCAEVVIALGHTLESGAFKAWLVDSLYYYQYDGDLIGVFNKAQRYTKIVTGIGAVAGAYLGQYDMSLSLLAGGLFYLVISFLSWLLMKEEYWQTRSINRHSWWQNIQSTIVISMQKGWQCLGIRQIIIVFTVCAFCYQPLNMYWQPHFGQYLATKYYGYIFVGIIVFSLAGNEVITLLTRRNIAANWLKLINLLIIGCGCIGAAVWQPLFWTLLFYLLHEMGRGMLDVYYDVQLHQQIDSEQRATIDSFVSMMRTGGACLGLLLFGWLANQTSIRFTWLLAGVIIGLSSLPAVWKRFVRQSKICYTSKTSDDHV